MMMKLLLLIALLSPSASFLLHVPRFLYRPSLRPLRSSPTDPSYDPSTDKITKKDIEKSIDKSVSDAVDSFEASRARDAMENTLTSSDRTAQSEERAVDAIEDIGSKIDRIIAESGLANQVGLAREATRARHVVD